MSVRLPLFAIACGVALLTLPGCGSQPVAAGSSPATTAAAPTSAAPSRPAAADPAATASAQPAGASARPATGAPAGGCPVTAAQLQKGMRSLSDGWRIDAASIQCSHGWAQAKAIAPTAQQQGDGVVLFRFDPSAGHWVEDRQGSAIRCATVPAMTPRAAEGLSVCGYTY